jgi:opacity protein-like surface antigen
VQQRHPPSPAARNPPGNHNDRPHAPAENGDRNIMKLETKTTISTLATMATLTALGLLATPSAAHADDSRWYATLDAGIGFLGSEDLNYRDATTDVTAEADFDASFTGGATVGYRLNDAWRVEGEIMYRTNELSDVTLPGLGTFGEGDFSSVGIGASVIRDFDLFGSPRAKSYVGAGVVFVQEIDIDFEAAGAETSFETDDVALQLQAGVRYDLGDRLFLDAGLRYLTASGVEMEFPEDTSRIVEADYSPLTVTAGIGWRF